MKFLYFIFILIFKQVQNQADGESDQYLNKKNEIRQANLPSLITIAMDVPAYGVKGEQSYVDIIGKNEKLIKKLKENRQLNRQKRRHIRQFERAAMEGLVQGIGYNGQTDELTSTELVKKINDDNIYSNKNSDDDDQGTGANNSEYDNYQNNENDDNNNNSNDDNNNEGNDNNQNNENNDNNNNSNNNNNGGNEKKKSTANSAVEMVNEQKKEQAGTPGNLPRAGKDEFGREPTPLKDNYQVLPTF